MAFIVVHWSLKPSPGTLFVEKSTTSASNVAFTLIISFLVFKRRNDRDIDNEYGDDNFSRIVNSIYELGTQVRCSIVLTSFLTFLTNADKPGNLGRGS